MPIKYTDTQEVEAIIAKDPDADLPFAFDWSKWLPDGYSVSTASWDVPTGLTGHDAAVTGGVKATIFLSGGTAGTSYVVRCRISTNGAPPLTDDRSFVVKVGER